MKLLFVDHSRVFRSVWERMMLHAGLEPLIASDGRSALALIEREGVDFICVSLTLPDVDGIQFIRQVRASPRGRGVPIVLLTSAQDGRTRRQAFEAGATDVCPKTAIEALFQRAARFTRPDEQRLSGHVLYVEDSRAVSRIMIRLLESMGLSVDHFVSADEARSRFDAHRHDLVISDILVEGDMSGLALVSQLREIYPDKIRVPILAMSGLDDPTRRVELFRLGINDFISKPVLPEEAAARIRNLIVQKQLFDQVQQQRIQLYELAMTDALTGLYNRNSLAEFSERLAALGQDSSFELSVIVIDLDHFKQINDEHGHLSGDQVLAGVSGMLSRCCRRDDFAVRFGGEELLLIMPHCAPGDAARRAEELRARIESLRPAGIGLTASLGVAARIDFAQPVNLQDIIRRADQAVYEAKNGGRNRVAIDPQSPISRVAKTQSAA